jgi:hypothetical protein
MPGTIFQTLDMPLGDGIGESMLIRVPFNFNLRREAISQKGIGQLEGQGSIDSGNQPIINSQVQYFSVGFQGWGDKEGTLELKFILNLGLRR